MRRCGGERGAGSEATAHEALKGSATSKPLPGLPDKDWLIDFASEVTKLYQRLRRFSFVEAQKRGCLAQEVGTSLPNRQATRALERPMAIDSWRSGVRFDSGPKMCNRHSLA